MRKLSLRLRIFFAMLVLVIFSSVTIVLVSVKQFKKQNENYYKSRLERKEEAARTNINYELQRSIYPISQQFLTFIFKDRIYELASVHKMRFSVYNILGEKQIGSSTSWMRFSNERIPKKILNQIRDNKNYRISQTTEDGKILQSSYSFIEDSKLNQVGILKIEYLQDNSKREHELSVFLEHLFWVNLALIVLAIIIAYFISSYVTRSLKSISDKMQETNLTQTNKKIEIEGISKEIKQLVDAYNEMIDALAASAEKLAKSEREQAWREMAKQVAHEIKNPLTPMRLTVQSFERKFDPKDPEIHQKVKDYSDMLIQQIDVMTSIASAFSDFAQMPKKHIAPEDIVSLIKSSLEIFYEQQITFETAIESVILEVDKNQITRVVNNLVKNAIQATEHLEKPLIKIKLTEDFDDVVITIKDNGIGIDEKQQPLIFEPKFTTKTSGMGLGLPMVKNIIEAYNGTISFSSVVDLGTEFKIRLPKQ